MRIFSLVSYFNVGDFMKKLLQISCLSKTYFSKKKDVEVLKDISLDVFENEIVSLLGPSGCGKSTLLNIISSLDENYKGEVICSSKLGYMFQNDTLLEYLNIFDNITLGLEIKKIKTKENVNYALELCKKYGLEKFLYQYPSSLSGGMRQRVSLIRTLVLKPDLLLLDEPFSRLDAQTRLLIQEDVYSIIKKEGISALIVTHDIEEAIALSNRILIMSCLPSFITSEIIVPFTSSPLSRRKEKEFSSLFSTSFSKLKNASQSLH